jgi:hypothetical protein
MQEEYALFPLNASIESLSLEHVMIDMIDAGDSRSLVSVGPQAMVQSLRADFSVRDPALQAIPLRLEAGARIDRLSWGLDWQSKVADVGKDPILNHGGTIQQLHWVHTPPKYATAELDKADANALTVKFSEPVKSSDFRNGSRIEVNGKLALISEATRQPSGEAVRYRITPAVSFGDAVTWAYDAANGSIQNLDGDNMLSVGPKDIGMIR